MSGRAWVLILLVWGTAWAFGEPPPAVKKTETGCVISTDREGTAWIGRGEFPLPRRHPRYSSFIGMFGYVAPRYGFEYRLSERAAKKLAPLAVTDAEQASGPKVFASLEFEGSLAGELPPGSLRRQPTGGTQLVYDVDSVHLIEAEFVSPRWDAAWKRFDRLLEDIVEVALEAPTEEKRPKLEVLMDEAGRELGVLMTPEIEDEWRRTVDSIEPGAKVVTTQQEKAAAGRAEVLGMCIERLGITPKASDASGLPEEPGSPAEPGIPAAATAERKDESVPPLTHRPIPVPDLSLTAHIADVGVLRKNLILGGIVIDSVTSEEDAGGLRPGDVVLTCTTATHLERWTKLGVGFPWAKESEAVSWTLRHMKTAARQFPDLELAGHAQSRKPYPFLVLRDGEVVNLRPTGEGKGRGK